MIYVIFKIENGKLVLSYISKSNMIITCLIVDTKGIIYNRIKRNLIAEEPGIIYLDCSNLFHGQYILYINAGKETISNIINI